MNDKRNKLIFRIALGLVTALMLMSSSMYFFKHDMVSDTFTKLGYPTYIIYPLAIAKLLGLVAIWTNKSKLLKEWAYAGFFFDFILALGAHLAISDGEFAPALVGIVLIVLARFFDKR